MLQSGKRGRSGARGAQKQLGELPSNCLGLGMGHKGRLS